MMKFNRSLCHPYPLITAIRPASVQLQGQRVTVIGRNFELNMSVWVGGMAVRTTPQYHKSWRVMAENGQPVVAPQSKTAVSWWHMAVGNQTNASLCDLVSIMHIITPPETISRLRRSAVGIPPEIVDGSLFGLDWGAPVNILGIEHQRFSMWAPCMPAPTRKSLLLQTPDGRLSVRRQECVIHLHLFFSFSCKL